MMYRNTPFVTRIRAILIVAILGVSLLSGYAVTRAATSAPPILLIVNSAAVNPFGNYLAEILRAEGLNSFETVQLSSVTATILADHKLAVLAETSLSASQATLLRTYVSGGGRLLAMRPDAQLRDLFGLGSQVGSLGDPYLKINSSGAGLGLTSATMQIHGTADYYSALSGTTVVAQLYSNSTNPTSYPAVVSATYGSGQTVAFTYDLAHSVIYTRQGNPANANLDTDGDGVRRTIDLFEGSGGGAPWVNRDKIAIPQADEQQRLFARLAQNLLSPAHPMPQFWYFPGNAKTMLVLTADAHANPSSSYQTEVSSLNAHGATATFYLAMAGDPTNVELKTWYGQGQMFGIHPYSYRPDPYPYFNITNLSEGYSATELWWYLHNFSGEGVPRSRTIRHHQVAWQGWTDAADIAANHGYALDTNFYHWGPWLQRPDGSWPYGYITGSGQPMRFARADGTIIPLFQQLTQLVDEQLVAGAGNGVNGLNATQALAISRQMIDASQSGDYAALMTQFHVDYYSGDAQVWAEGTVDYANSHGVPVWNADRWLQFVETRYGANYSTIVWNDTTSTLSFDLTASTDVGVNLTTMLPLNYGGRLLNAVTVDGSPATFSNEMIKGENVAFVSTPAGNHSFTAMYTPLAEVTPSTTPVYPTTGTPIPSSPTSTNTPITPTATNTQIGVPTSTNTSTPDPSTATNTSTPDPSGDLVHTTTSDFQAACVGTNGTLATLDGDGAVGLDGAFRDTFDGPSLDTSRWVAGTWNGGTYTPTFLNGAVQVIGSTGASLRSSSTFTTRTLEGVAEFGGSAWQHLGFGSLGFSGDQYLLFSTIGTNTTLFARSNSGGGEVQTNLGLIPVGRHTYRIEWTRLANGQDQIRYLIDNALRATHTVNAAPALYAYASYNSGGSAPALQIDSLRVLPPYAASGTFTSCALDANLGNTWTTASWIATTPVGTSLSVEVRTSADGLTWGTWATTTTGTQIASPDRFVQYRLNLGTIDTSLTPLVTSFTLSRGQPASSTNTPTSTSTSAPSTNTPTSTSTSAPSTNTPISTNTSAPSTNTPISTNTSAPSTSTPISTNTPISTSTSAPPTSTSAPPTSTPTATNTPVPATNTPVPPPSDVVHTTLADFQTACVVSSNTLAVAGTDDGAVGLDGAFRDTFDGPSLDTSRWVAGTWNGGTYTPTFLNGAVQVIGSTGASLRSSSTFTTRTLEGVAEFGAGAWQHLGFGSLGFSGDQYLLFSTIGTSTTLFARSNSGGGEVQTNLGAIPVGRHTYRIEWTRLANGQDQIRYLIDGTLRATHTVNAAPALYAYASYNSGGNAPALQIDSLRVLPPYAASGTFTSCALDANLGNTWTTVSWIATTPVGTSLSVEVRTSADGLTWGNWTTTTAGTQIASPNRFVQYRLNLGTTDTSLTPLVTSLTLSRGQPASSTSTPISTSTLAPSTSTPISTSTLAPSTSTPISTSTSAPSTSTPTSSNTPVPATNTPVPPPSDVVHTTLADFQTACVGTNGTLATLDGDGAVGLDGAFRDTFDGPSLDTTRWVAGTWNGGTYTPTFLNGAVQVIGSTGASLRSSSTFTTRTLEGVAEFGAGAWQHLGFGSLGFSGDQYLLFSTIGTSTTLFARSNSGGGEVQTNLGAIPVGRHTYRIEWIRLASGQDQIRYLIDNTLRATHTVNAAPALYAYASYNSGGSAPALQIDSLRVLPPYAASGTFTSCALDANLGNTWTTASWIATTPVGSSLSVEVRTSADGLTWSTWATTTTGAQIASPQRFVQYRLNLGTTDTSLTPLVTSLTLSRVAATGQ